MDYAFILLMCGLVIIAVAVGYRMGKDVRIIEVKENQTVRYLEEPSYEDEDASVPEEV